MEAAGEDTPDVSTLYGKVKDNVRQAWLAIIEFKRSDLPAAEQATRLTKVAGLLRDVTTTLES